jgi:S-adenosylmethionine/arginine decarboxylase-like enzyme
VFDDININDRKNWTGKTRLERTIKLSPIFVTRINNFQPLSQILEEIAINDYEIKIINNEEVKIQPKGSTYVNIVKELNSKDMEFHIYKPKQKRNFKVVLEHIFPLSNMDGIRKRIERIELKIKDIPVTNIWNIKKQRTKIFPIFYIKLKPKNNNNEISISN